MAWKAWNRKFAGAEKQDHQVLSRASITTVFEVSCLVQDVYFCRCILLLIVNIYATIRNLKSIVLLLFVCVKHENVGYR